jgi:hypothetical protein
MRRFIPPVKFDSARRVIMRLTIIFAILTCFIMKGGMVMAEELSLEQQTAKLKQEVGLLTQQLEVFKAQAALNSAKEIQDALSAKILLDALKEQAASQSAFTTAQAQLPFAELQGIKAGTSGLKLPEGKEGTIKVSAGAAGTALLRGKQPMLERLDAAADYLAGQCPEGTVILTEAQLGQASSAKFTIERIKNEIGLLDEAAKNADPIDNRPAIAGAAFLPAAIAGAYAVGIALDTINNLAKLLRTNRQLDVFGTDTEAAAMLGYLLESKDKKFLATPGMLGNNAVDEADKLMKQLNDLAEKLQNANDILSKIKKYSEDIAKADANDPIRTQVQMPDAQTISLLKSRIDNATSLLDGLNPSKKSDAFWAQVSGQVIAENIKGKSRLFIEAKAQVVQVTESRWYTSDRILTTGEVQVAFRLLKEDGTLDKSGIILKASKAAETRIDELNELDWIRPKQP